MPWAKLVIPDSRTQARDGVSTIVSNPIPTPMMNRAILIIRTEYAEAAITEPTVNQMHPNPITIFRPTCQDVSIRTVLSSLNLTRNHDEKPAYRISDQSRNERTHKSTSTSQTRQKLLLSIVEGMPQIRVEQHQRTRDDAGIVPEEIPANRGG